jgi:hypothetical protein
MRREIGTPAVKNIMETVAPASAPVDSRFTEFNIRQDASHFVRLHDLATKRFESYVRSFGSNLEGGILLGTVDLAEQWSITVKDFTPVLCEHRRDGRSSFVDCPAQCFKNAIRRASQSPKNNRTIIGYYRCHTRPEFSLEKEDHDIARKYFAKDARFLLLVKPSNAGYATGMFYLSLEGQLDPERSSVEFPISLKELGAEVPPEEEDLERVVIPALDPIPVPAPVPAPVPQAPAAPAAPVVRAAPPPAPLSAPPASRLSEQFWKGAAAAAILLGSVFAVRSYRAPSDPETAIVHPAPVNTAPAPTNAEPAPSQPKPAAPVASPAPAAPAPVVQSRRPEPAPPSAPEKTSSVPRVEPKKFVLSVQQKPASTATVLSNPPEAPASGIALSTPTLPAPTVPAPALPVAPPTPAPVVQAAPAPVVSSAPPVAPPAPATPAHVVRQASPVVPDAVKRKLRGDVVVRVLVDIDVNG